MNLAPAIRTTFHFGAVFVLSLLLIGCESGTSNGSDSTTGGSDSGSTAGGPESTTGGSVTTSVFSTAETPAKTSDLITPIETDKTAVVINNADGQIPLDDPAQDWTKTGNCGNGNVGLNSGGGKRHFLTLSTGCELTQISETESDNANAISLQFAVSADSQFTANLDNPSVTLIAEILGVSSSGTIQVLQAKDVAIESTALDWQRRQVLVNFDESIIPGTAIVGVRFKAKGDVDFNWYLSDVAIDVFDKSDDNGEQFSDSWAGVCNQIWVGSNYWANRNRDWNVIDGQLQARNGSQYRPLRTVHRITSYMSATPENFSLSVKTGSLAAASGNAYSGILLGAGNGLDYRAAALVHNRSGRNGGLIIGVRNDGRVFLHDNDIKDTEIAAGAISELSVDGVTLTVTGEYFGNSVYRLTASSTDADGQVLSSATADIAAHRMMGNIGLISNPGISDSDHWFEQFQGFGAKLKEVSAREFGPILMSTYTVSRNELTLNAQFPQMCVDKFEAPTLSMKRDGAWVEVATAEIDPAAYVSRFTVAAWNPNQEALYRVALKSSTSDAAHYYYGVIQAAPTAADEFIITTYNCRPGVILSDTEGWIQQNNLKAFTWSAERIPYPHAELMENSAQHGSHMLAFLGDQIYEFDPNGFIDKSTTDLLIEDYFWKWQQFIFTVREYTRSTPSFIIPDDHDVYQANVWGAGGIAALEEGNGGYVYAAEFIQIVQKTQTGSLPRSTDTTPVAQGIDVYFTDIVYGGVGLVVLEDRKFKSSPGTPDVDAILLGDRQLSFLDSWARDWDNQQLKLTVSQSPFAQGTTHTGALSLPNRFDKDSNGWPKIGRDKAVAAMRKASSPHINGDQHLGMSLQHGITKQKDAVHSFAGPSMLNIFPRIWDPLNLEAGPGDRSVEYVGEYTDAHGNLMEILAAANPDSYYLPRTERSWQKDQLGIGYGIVRMNKPLRTYEFAAWPADVDPLAAGATPYSGWPILVDQTDNDGRTPVGFLEQRIAPVEQPVVVVTNEVTQETVYARRYTDSTVDLPVFDASASYTVEISDDASGYREEFVGQVPVL